MKIDPRSHQPASRPLAGESQPTARPGAEPSGNAAVPGAPLRARDRVEISDAARQLFETSANGEVPSGSMSPERLRQVLDRIRGGEYDRPEVIRMVAERVASSVLES